MQIILIGNYPPDRQESMQRFAQMLDTGFRQAGFATTVWLPKVFFGALARHTDVGLGKWLGYLDKWVLFPLILRWRLRGKQADNCCFHICDHSNSPYLSYLPANQTGITCHDVLAIRGGLGHADAYVGASRLGKLLQTWILSNLSRAERLAAVSHFTLNQLRELATPAAASLYDWRVIHNAFNANFWPMPATQSWSKLHAVSLSPDTPFLLHVGSDLPRKNRALLLDMVAALGSRWAGTICFAGAALDSALLAHAAVLNLQSRIVSVVSPDHETLVALYSSCAAFVFPSYSEGFGWPVIEAQACGAPVLASNVAPMPEVSGGAALHASPDDAQAFADNFLQLLDTSVRQATIEQGFGNCHRFEPAVMIDAYLNLLSLKKTQPALL
jgi:glycosyltransferase involved in cell wall biosynthesis